MTILTEQQELPIKYDTGGHAEFRDAAASENKALPVHRWVPWVAGFSARFVEDAIQAYLPMAGHGRHLVLDPFAGVGTTLVEALNTGCNAIGYEINAFAALAADAKINCTDVPPERFKAEIDAFRSTMQQLESDIDRLWAEDGAQGVDKILGTLRTASPIHFRSRIQFFSPPVEAKFLFALARTASVPDPYRALFRVALGATMISFSNYSYEPSLSSRPGAGKALVENASVALAVLRKLHEFSDDIEWMRANYGRVWARRRREVLQDSYLDSQLPPGSVSLLVTSPPYMNNYHYVRNTRPQLYWLSLIHGSEDLKQNEEHSFGKFWQTVRQRHPIELDCQLRELADKIAQLRCSNVERGPYGGPGWANYVATYFNDCSRFLGLAKTQLRSRAHAVIVVGNSIIQGIEFKVDHLFGQIAERHGFKLEDIRIVRTKRVGNSIIDSSVRNGDRGEHKQKTQLYDAAVVLRA